MREKTELINEEYLITTTESIGKIFDEHRKATQEREEEVWNDILEDNRSQNVVIWAFEASPSIINAEGKFLIDSKTLLHNNYMFGTYEGIKMSSYVFLFLKHHLGINEPDVKATKCADFIEVLRNGGAPPKPLPKDGVLHLIIDLVPGWHGTAVNAQMRRKEFGKGYSNKGLIDLLNDERLKDKSIHLVWCGTKISKNIDGAQKPLYDLFFEGLIGLNPKINFYYKPNGFFNPPNIIKTWPMKV